MNLIKTPGFARTINLQKLCLQKQKHSQLRSQLSDTIRALLPGIVFLAVSATATDTFADGIQKTKAESHSVAIKLPGKLPGHVRQMENYLTDLPVCNALSGALLYQGDAYYDLLPVKSTTTDKRKLAADINELNQLIAELEGEWMGDAAEVVCFLSGSARVHVYEVDELDIRNTASNRRYLAGHRELAVVTVDRLRIATSEEDVSTGDVRNIERFTLPQLAHLQHIEKLEDGQFMIRSFFRERAAATGATVLREREDWLAKNGNKLTWRTDWHTNGHYSGSEFSLLQRRR